VISTHSRSKVHADGEKRFLDDADDAIYAKTRIDRDATVVDAVRASLRQFMSRFDDIRVRAR